MSLGPNDSVGCPSVSHLRTALAHGRICPTCEPDVEWSTRCPSCWRTAPVVGLVVQPHLVGGRGFRTVRQDCPGEGQLVEPPPVVDRPVWQAGKPRLGVVQDRELVPGGAA